jgi:hypothetical protein
MTSYQKACKSLEIEDVLSIAVVRKQYKLLALKYHPDKNKSTDASAKYQEIKEAHDYLLKYLDNHAFTGDSSTSWSDSSTSWSSSVSSFFETLYNNQHLQKRVFHPLLMRIIETCETKIFENMDSRRANKIYEILVKYKDSLHLSDDFLKRVYETIRVKVDAVILLNPNLDDLLNQSVYKYKVDDLLCCYIPLWHSELIYDKHKLVVQCEPELQDNIELDEYNNIHVSLQYNLTDIWGKERIEFPLGNTQTRTFCLDSLKLTKESQCIVREREGIPVANTVDIYNVDQLSDIYLHITLC